MFANRSHHTMHIMLSYKHFFYHISLVFNERISAVSMIWCKVFSCRFWLSVVSVHVGANYGMIIWVTLWNVYQRVTIPYSRGISGNGVWGQGACLPTCAFLHGFTCVMLGVKTDIKRKSCICTCGENLNLTFHVSPKDLQSLVHPFLNLWHESFIANCL